MKILTKIAAITLVLCLSFGNMVMATGSLPPDNNDNSNLQNIINDLMRENEQLRRDLEEAERNPMSTLPRRPVIQITDPLLVEIEAGGSRTVSFTLENLTNHAATSVVTTVDLRGAQGVTGRFTDRSNNIASMGNRNQRTLTYEISVNENAEEEFHTIVFTHSFLNERNATYTNESRVIVSVVNRDDGRVMLRDIQSSLSSVNPGGNFDLTAIIYNESRHDMRDISLTITEGMASDGVFLRASTNVVNLANLRGGRSENISIGFSASPRARRGAYPLTLQLAYTDRAGERVTRDYRFFVNVGGVAGEDGSEVVVTGISHPSGSIGIGQVFEMVVTLRNTSEHTARNIRVDAAAGTGGEGAIVPRTTSIAQVAQLEPGAERRLSFSFAPTSAARSQNYVIGFSVSYETGREDADGGDEVITFTQYQGVNVYNPDEEDDDDRNVSIPRIIVSDFRSDPMIVHAGHEFDLEITFLNTSNRAVRNIRINLSVEEGEVTQGNERRGSVFTPVGRSNTFFIDRIEPRSEVTEHIRYFTLPDAPPRNYIINVDFDYEDEDNNRFEARESIGINVAQVTRFDTSEIFIPEFAQAFSPIFVSFEIYNTGRVTLSNLMIRVEGDGFSANQSSVFYGSLNPGAMDFYDNVITPTEGGLQELAIIITFEDDSAQQIEERLTFTVDVAPPMDFDDMMLERPPFPGDDMVWDDNLQMFVPAAGGGLPVAAIAGAGLGGLALCGGGAFAIMRILKKRRESMVDIDE
ncbi:MAG: hypothetical protein FWE24_11535 [Defluviitaleaceae bacterium]|nr:hypothetical protein [Defluviitaleaceae bacterium]